MYSKEIFDLPFEISRLLEEFKGKLSGSPLNIISVVGECSRLINTLGSIPSIKLQNCSTILSVFKVTVNAIRRSKSYNRVVEY